MTELLDQAFARVPYLIFYETTATDIIVHAVRHGARDPASMPDAP